MTSFFDDWTGPFPYALHIYFTIEFIVIFTGHITVIHLRERGKNASAEWVRMCGDTRTSQPLSLWTKLKIETNQMAVDTRMRSYIIRRKQNPIAIFAHFSNVKRAIFIFIQLSLPLLICLNKCQMQHVVSQDGKRNRKKCEVGVRWISLLRFASCIKHSRPANCFLTPCEGKRIVKIIPRGKKTIEKLMRQFIFPPWIVATKRFARINHQISNVRQSFNWKS